jgi:hypothetical protein
MFFNLPFGLLFEYHSILLTFVQVVDRYEGEFGIRNHRFTIGKVEFVAVDSQTLDGKIKKPFTLHHEKTFAFCPNI